MSIILHHHPWSRAAIVVAMLEELGEPYELRFVDLMVGAQQSNEHRAKNRMSKVPVVEDHGATISETGAIGVYLADRYALGRLAPALDDVARGPYLRWCFFGPAVIEPACMAKSSGWDYKPASAGFGSYENVVATLDEGLATGPWLLGEQFTMADVLIGSTLRWMLQFDMIERTDIIGAYVDRFGERPAIQRAAAKNEAIVKERGLTPPGA